MELEQKNASKGIYMITDTPNINPPRIRNIPINAIIMMVRE